MKIETATILSGMMANPNLAHSIQHMRENGHKLVGEAMRLSKEPDSSEGAFMARDAIEALLEIGKRDLSNEKYDGYFVSLRDALVQLNRETRP